MQCHDTGFTCYYCRDISKDSKDNAHKLRMCWPLIWWENSNLKFREMLRKVYRSQQKLLICLVVCWNEAAGWDAVFDCWDRRWFAPWKDTREMCPAHDVRSMCWAASVCIDEERHWSSFINKETLTFIFFSSRNSVSFLEKKFLGSRWRCFCFRHKILSHIKIKVGFF